MNNYFFKKFNFGIFFLQISNLIKQGSFGVNLNYEYTPKPKHKELEGYNGRFDAHVLIGLIKYQISFGIDITLKGE